MVSTCVQCGCLDEAIFQQRPACIDYGARFANASAMSVRFSLDTWNQNKMGILLALLAITRSLTNAIT